ncbi:hypothetical protein GA0074695_4291 [Micromonospora viridifaciens]|uniref:Uncharacterized protein n=1 Tax=Micromonospora viridifaciens TaxID=1881 RepID=A0A1C4YHI0_MICVI|nr:hypothetical protein GA0074695_4291 [Micromonospora viridifaciens]
MSEAGRDGPTLGQLSINFKGSLISDAISAQIIRSRPINAIVRRSCGFAPGQSQTRTCAATANGPKAASASTTSACPGSPPAAAGGDRVPSLRHGQAIRAGPTANTACYRVTARAGISRRGRRQKRGGPSGSSGATRAEDDPGERAPRTFAAAPIRHRRSGRPQRRNAREIGMVTDAIHKEIRGYQGPLSTQWDLFEKAIDTHVKNSGRSKGTRTVSSTCLTMVRQSSPTFEHSCWPRHLGSCTRRYAPAICSTAPGRTRKTRYCSRSW